MRRLWPMKGMPFMLSAHCSPRLRAHFDKREFAAQARRHDRIARCVREPDLLHRGVEEFLPRRRPTQMVSCAGSVRPPQKRACLQGKLGHIG